MVVAPAVTGNNYFRIFVTTAVSSKTKVDVNMKSAGKTQLKLLSSASNKNSFFNSNRMKMSSWPFRIYYCRDKIIKIL